MKTRTHGNLYTTTGLQQVGSGASSLHQGSPRLCAPGWPVLMSCKGILKDASNDMSCQSLLQQSTQQLTYHKYNILPPIAKATMSKVLNVDWGDDTQITNGINLRKSLARDYALNKLYARHYCYHVFK